MLPRRHQRVLPTNRQLLLSELLMVLLEASHDSIPTSSSPQVHTQQPASQWSRRKCHRGEFLLAYFSTKNVWLLGNYCFDGRLGYLWKPRFLLVTTNSRSYKWMQENYIPIFCVKFLSLFFVCLFAFVEIRKVAKIVVCINNKDAVFHKYKHRTVTQIWSKQWISEDTL